MTKMVAQTKKQRQNSESVHSMSFGLDIALCVLYVHLETGHSFAFDMVRVWRMHVVDTKSERVRFTAMGTKQAH